MSSLFDDLPAAEKTQPLDWRRGYDIAYLKKLAEPFKSAAPYVYGAFGIAKERDVAAALAAGEYVSVSDDDYSVAAIVKWLVAGSRRKDFRGIQIEIAAGSTVCWDIGLTPAANSSGVGAVLDGSWGPVSPVQWVEWFEEDPRRDLLLDLGFSYIGTRIAAGSEIKGLYARWRHGSDRVLTPVIAAEDRTSIACLAEDFIGEEERLAIMAELGSVQWSQLALLAELGSVHWSQHYASYNKLKSWTAVALRGYAPQDPSFIIKPAEMSDSWKREHIAEYPSTPDWTIIADQFPTVRAVIDRIGRHRLDRVRFMRLSADGGELTRHADITDRDAGTANGKVMRLHIPIQTAESCRFSSWGIRGQRYERHFPARALCYLDQRRPHAVKNPDSVDRIHLVIDAYADDELRARFASADWRCDD